MISIPTLLIFASGNRQRSGKLGDEALLTPLSDPFSIKYFSLGNIGAMATNMDKDLLPILNISSSQVSG